MLTNYERVIKRFLPAFRQSAARMMVREYGIRQQSAAEMLGTTQAAVSKYLSGNRRGSGIKIDNDLLREFVEGAIQQKGRDAQRAMCKMCQGNIKFDCALMVK